MDPLERLAEKNKKYEKIRRKERFDSLRLLPVAIIGLTLYLAAYLYLMSYEGDTLGVRFLGATKQIWALSMVVFIGIGSLFFSGSLAFIIYTHQFMRKLGAKINSLTTLLISVLLLFISFTFLLGGKWIHNIIVNSNKEIAMFFHSDFDKTPLLITLVLSFIVIVIALQFFTAFLVILGLPFQAKKHAEEYALNKTIK